MGYFRPRTLAEALTVLDAESPVVAAGCTDLFPARPGPELIGPVLDITNINEMTGISQRAGGWRIGAAVSWSELAQAELPPAFDGLKQAAREVGAIQIQNMGTLGGNLCNASPAADGVPPLLTLGAYVELVSRAGSRLLPLADFILGPRRTALKKGELLTAIHLRQAEGRSAFRKLGARRYLVISIVMAAVRIAEEDGLISEAALCVGACSPVAVRLPALEAALLGKPLAEAAGFDADLLQGALTPLTDIRADAAYRSHAAAELLRRALSVLAEGGAK